ncbi:hypothetical protein [Hyphomicrobium sp. CS1BSMeth3]|uniref:hypothetical protein n=1 Tax=Hyphomicrobium sp. CS1BSMeth3 TaxID=1892844 RepID=UPI000930F16B|nr:hypothetical protein [Hyphomicrobium sp. CS1BSMeth3]
MAIEVEGPDGTVIEFPDDTSSDVMKGVLAKRYPASDSKTPGMIESFARGAGTGATFGFDDELGLQDKDAREAARKANPWTYFAGEMAGGMVPVAAAGPLGVLAKGGSMIARGARAITGAFAPQTATTFTQAAGQGLKLGLTHGAMHGAGNAEGGLVERAKGAGSGAVISGLSGLALGPAIHAVSRTAQHMAGARAAAAQETDDASQGALMAISRGLERDRISPDDIVAGIRSDLPSSTAMAGGNRYWGSANARQPWTDDMIEDVVLRTLDGETPGAIARALQVNGRGPSTGAINTLLKDMEFKSRGPLNLVDRAGMVRPGSGDNTQMTLRAAAATPGEARSIAREALLERQVGAGSRLGQAFERLIGSGDFEGVAARHSEALRGAGTKAYAAAFQAEKPFDLRPIVLRHMGRFDNRRGPVPEEMMSAINSLTTNTQFATLPGGPAAKHLTTPQTLQEFIDARQNLSAAIDAAARRYGASSGPTRALTQLRQELTDEVARTNPAWKAANDIWRDGKAAEDAMAAGASMAMRLNARTREGLREFVDAKRALGKAKRDRDVAGQDAALARIDLFKVGLVRSLNEQIANNGMTADLTRTLRMPAARQILGDVLGKKEAAQLLRVVNAEHAMHRTYGSQFGSQTTPLKEAVDDLNWAPRMSSASDLMRPGKWLELAGDAISSRYNASRNRQMMPMLTDENPMRQLQLMRAVDAVSRARGQAGQVVGQPLMSGVGPLGGALTAENQAGWDEAERRRQHFNELYGGEGMAPGSEQPQGGYIPNAGEGELPMPEAPPGEMTLPDYGLGPMTQRTQRGLPNPELRSSLPTVDGHGIPSGDVAREAIAQHGPGIAYEMTGIPSIQRGAGNIQRGYQEGDPLRAAAGGGEAVLGMVPAGSLVRGGKALKAATATPGRTAAAAGATLGPMAAADVRDARASGQEKVAAAVEADPTVQRHRARLEKLREDLAASQGSIKGLSEKAADKSRAEKAKPIQAEIAQLVGKDGQPGIIQQAEQKAAQNYLYNAPFRERYPGTAEALIYGGGALAFGLSGVNAMRHRYADRFVHAPAIERQAEKVETALRGTTTQPNMLQRAMGRQPETIQPNQGRFEMEREVLRNKLAARAEADPYSKETFKKNALAGALVIQEAKMIPEEIDAMSFPPGHPARVAAEEQLRNPMYYLSGAVPSIVGGLAIGKFAPPVAGAISPSRMDTPRGRAAADLRWKGEKAPPPEPPSRINRLAEATTQRLEGWIAPPQRPTRADRIKDAATERVESWLRPAPRPINDPSVLRTDRGPSSVNLPRTNVADPVGTPATPSASPAAAGAGREQIPPTGTSAPPPGLPRSLQEERGGPARSANRSSRSSPVYSKDEHTVAATSVIEGYLARRQVPSFEQMRTDIVQAFEKQGLKAPPPSVVTRKVRETHAVAKAIEGADPETQRKVLAATLGKAPFLAVPAAIGAGAAASDYGERNMLAQPYY